MTKQKVALREGFEETHKQYGKLHTPFYTPLGRRKEGIVKFQYHCSDEKRAIKITYYRVQLNLEWNNEQHDAFIAFDPADDGPHRDEENSYGDKNKTYLNFDYDGKTGYKEAWDDANDMIRINFKKYASNFKNGRWPSYGIHKRD